MGNRYNNDFRSRETVALRDILQFKAENLPISTVDISRDGMASFDLSALMAEQLGLGSQAATIHDTSLDFQNPAVRGTNGLAIWLKPSIFETSGAERAREFQQYLRPAIKGFCDALFAKHHIAIYPAFIPIDAANSAAGSVLVLMSDSKGQAELLSTVRQDLLRELGKMRKTLPDNPNMPPSASR